MNGAIIMKALIKFLFVSIVGLLIMFGVYGILEILGNTFGFPTP